MKNTFIICALFISATVQAAESGWSSNRAQGTTEYQLQGKGQSRLYFVCNPDENAFVQYTDVTGKSASSKNTGIPLYASVDNGSLCWLTIRFLMRGASSLRCFGANLGRASRSLSALKG